MRRIRGISIPRTVPLGVESGPGGGNPAAGLSPVRHGAGRVCTLSEDLQMARVNAFARVSNDAGRSVSVGGRGSADSVRGWFNVDTAAGEISASVRAECVGHGLRSADRRRKSVGDGRAARFVFTLPNVRGFARPDLVTVELRDAEDAARGLLAFGAGLVAFREAVRVVDSLGDGTDAAEAAAASRSRVARAAELVPEPPPLPRVILPGGVEMSEAVAAVAWIRADPARAAAFAADRKGARDA